MMTPEQKEHAREQGVEHAKAYVSRELGRILKDVFGGAGRRGLISFSYKSSPYYARHIAPRYRERPVDSELLCPSCKTRFQVRGIFGYCPGCRHENLLIYDANLSIIRQEIAQAPDQARALRHAYSDLVSAFEAFCRRKCPAEFRDQVNFQDLFEARRFFRRHRDVDILRDIPTEELLALRRVFQKRHAYLHNQGIVGKRYVRRIPEDSELLGQRATLSLGEFELGAMAMRRAVDRLISGTP